MPETKNTTYKTVKKTVKTNNPTNPEQTFYGINLITSSKITTGSSPKIS